MSKKKTNQNAMTPEATAGEITATVPTGTGNLIMQIGYAKSATELHLQLDTLGRRF